MLKDVRNSISNKIKKKQFTLIDYSIAVFIIFSLSFLAYFWLVKKPASIFIDLTFQRNQYEDFPTPPEFWQVDSIKSGDIAYNSLGRKIAQVVEVEKSNWGGGRRKNIIITLQLKATFNRKTKKYTLDDNPLLIGRDLAFNLGDTEFTGQIINLYQDQNDRFSQFQKAKAEVKVIYREYEPWHAENIRDFQVINSQNEAILTTKSVVIEPAEIIVETAAGSLVRRRHPTKKDITVTFELPQILCRENICFYKNFETFLIGGEFWADSGKTFIGPRSSIMDVKIIYDQ